MPGGKNNFAQSMNWIMTANSALVVYGHNENCLLTGNRDQQQPMLITKSKGSKPEKKDIIERKYTMFITAAKRLVQATVIKGA